MRTGFLDEEIDLCNKIGVEFSDWLTELRKEILQDTLDKIDGGV